MVVITISKTGKILSLLMSEFLTQALVIVPLQYYIKIAYITCLNDAAQEILNLMLAEELMLEE